ncbi:uncharacterized protein LOC129961900 [Argiope bruennichi]|uniref:uncharacterized protein LOC129961900 n=1 Tax=Argiope bruennichi TaxID=94029 RepID=UPI002494CF4D|nr:uncharacterized protein LOC129961900 [Argiope bruennichi]
MKWVFISTVFFITILLPSSIFSDDLTLISSNGNRKIISVEAACSEQAMMGQIQLQEPFYGSVYVRGFPLECQARGNGSREVTIIFSVNKCGTKITKLPNGKTQYEAVIYLQFDDKMQKLNDETYLLSCTSQNVVVISPKMSGMGSQSSISPKTSTPSKPVKEYDFDGWLDILQGKLPSLIPVTKPIFVGENLTVLIKIKHPDGFDAKVMNCIASDGTDMNKQLLIDSDGCALDSTVMPNLREKRGTKPFAKILYSTLQAFKFPRRRSLHVRCSIAFCNDTCPQDNCDSPWGRMQPMMQDHSFIGIQNLEVSDSVEVLARKNDSKTSSFQEHLTGTGSSKEELFCLNSTRILILISILLSVLLMSLVITICTCVRAKELRRRLLSQSFPYGKVSGCS